MGYEQYLEGFNSKIYSYLFTEYIEDICPYATFQLNKQTYSESSYSGNVYSGPYHSVRGSFVYHDVKPDGYQVVCKQTNQLNLPIHFCLCFQYSNLVSMVYFCCSNGVEQGARVH